MNPTGKIKILLADDHAIYRTGIKASFQAYAKNDFEIIAEATNGKEAVDLTKSVHPDVVLMDVAMPRLNGIQATAAIKHAYPFVRTISLSYSDASETVWDMIKAGADGYLLKDAGIEEVAHAVRTVSAGAPYFTPAMQMHLNTKYKCGTSRVVQSGQPLTKREREVLNRICLGENSREIADVLFIDKRTVDTHRERLFKKTGVKNVVQLLRYAYKNRLVKE